MEANLQRQPTAWLGSLSGLSWLAQEEVAQIMDADLWRAIPFGWLAIILAAYSVGRNFSFFFAKFEQFRSHAYVKEFKRGGSGYSLPLIAEVHFVSRFDDCKIEIEVFSDACGSTILGESCAYHRVGRHTLRMGDLAPNSLRKVEILTFNEFTQQRSKGNELLKGAIAQSGKAACRQADYRIVISISGKNHKRSKRETLSVFVPSGDFPNYIMHHIQKSCLSKAAGIHDADSPEYFETSS
ncbi:MAG: hypothetical protein ABJX46_06315 [Erythrobacter sp.]